MKKNFKLIGKSLLIVLIISTLLLIIGVSLPIDNYQQKGQKMPKLLVENCNIIDTKNGLTVSNQNIYIEDGFITTITNSPNIQRADYQIIDAKNKFVMPTLWDMHVHTLSLSPRLHFPLLIANGVINIRDIGDGDSWISDIDSPLKKDKTIWEKQAVENNLLIPNIWESCSYHVEEIEIDAKRQNVEVVKELITKLKNRNEPFVKLQLGDSELPDKIFYEIQHQANSQHIKVLGYLSYNVDIGTVLKNGYSTIEHAWALIPHFVKQKKRFEKDLDTKNYELLNQDSVLTNIVLQQMKENNTFYVPTHVASNRKETMVFDEKIY